MRMSCGRRSKQFRERSVRMDPDFVADDVISLAAAVRSSLAAVRCICGDLVTRITLGRPQRGARATCACGFLGPLVSWDVPVALPPSRWTAVGVVAVAAGGRERATPGQKAPSAESAYGSSGPRRGEALDGTGVRVRIYRYACRSLAAVSPASQPEERQKPWAEPPST